MPRSLFRGVNLFYQVCEIRRAIYEIYLTRIDHQQRRIAVIKEKLVISLGEAADIFFRDIPLVSLTPPAYSIKQNFQVRLRSPDEIEVVLYDGECFSTDRVNVGFDDDAPGAIECPPTNQIVYQPTEALSAFVGEESQGEWQLIVEIEETGFGAPGSIDGWAIEFCASSITLTSEENSGF